MILHYNKIFFNCISVLYELLYTYFVSIIDCRIKGNTSAFRLNHLFGAHWCVLNSIWNLSPPTVCGERDANIFLHWQWFENASTWQIFSRIGGKKKVNSVNNNFPVSLKEKNLIAIFITFLLFQKQLQAF